MHCFKLDEVAFIYIYCFLLLLKERSRALPPSCMSILVCPIYAALPPHEQLRIFQAAPPNTRKVILATNIAETSITINGVRYVVDPGFVKVDDKFWGGANLGFCFG